MGMAEMIPCSKCGDLIRVKEDIKYQKPECSRCIREKNVKKVLDKNKGDGTITCGICGRKYFKSSNPYSKTRCAYCFDERGKRHYWLW